MSLDVDLIEPCGHSVFELNVTHNLNKMAEAAGIYKALWRPEELGVLYAEDLIPRLQLGLDKLLADPETYKALNPENGWGTYEGLVRTVRRYLAACRDYPHATIEVSR
jgi:hypothetical protein